MHRREFSKAVCNAVAGLRFFAAAHQPPLSHPFSARRIKQTAAEALTGITPTDITYEPGDVRRYGADPTAKRDSTAAINRALKANRYVYALFGTFKISASLGPRGLVMAANQVFEGFSNATLSINADLVWAITATAISNVLLRGWTIIGNGSTGTNGFRAGRAVNFDGVSNFIIERLTISGLGNMNVIPTNDANNGGFGINILNDSANSSNGLITDCTITEIAGGGINAGDGIMISKWAGSPTMRDITIKDCSVSTCGRNCYSIATSTGFPTNIRLINCYAEKSSAAGLDIEDGINCTVEECHFSRCGNDQTFFDPLSVFGRTYRLLAGIATGNLDVGIIWRRCHVKGCYYGMTYGATSGLTIEYCRVENSIVSDITMGLASGATNMRLTNNKFLTPLDCFGYYSSASDIRLSVQDCTFAGRVLLSSVRGAHFVGNRFLKSLCFTGGPGSRDIVVERCAFADWPGPGIDLSAANIAVNDLQVIENDFSGAGTLSYGIRVGFSSAQRLVATGNRFTGLCVAGIGIRNGGGLRVLATVQANTFSQSASGIVCDAQGIRDGVIEGNAFTGVSGWCIDFKDIGAGNNLDGMRIINNVSQTDVTNGLRIAVTTGAFDNTVLTGNNFHSCSGVKWSVSAGNTHGYSANNITE